MNPKDTDLNHLLKDLPLLMLNIKTFGYELALKLKDELPKSVEETPGIHNLVSKPTTEQDMKSQWLSYWCNELKIGVFYHRKLWELGYVLQALFEHNGLKSGLHGLGFGCGEEPISSYLANRGIFTTVTDLPASEVIDKGWADTGQHLSTKESAWKENIVDWDLFDRHVDVEYVDMNDIPEKLHNNYDFCWSICAYEHLGSIEKGLQFVKNSLRTLKPGGIAVHTTEFNYLNNENTIDNAHTVLFQKQHFLTLEKELDDAGYIVEEFDFDIGSGVLDRYIDIPPYLFDWTEEMEKFGNSQEAHLKMAFNGYASTCYGVIIKKPS